MRNRNLEELKRKLYNLQNLNEGMWNEYGSELSAGDMLRQERELEDEIKELEAEAPLFIEKNYYDLISKELTELERTFQFAKSKKESDETLAKIVKLLPNDMDLGSYIRRLYSTKIS